jgi:cytochrome c biogenesis protein CcdA
LTFSIALFGKNQQTHVAAGLIGVTLLGIKMYQKVKEKISLYEKFISKISGAVLLVMALALIIETL